MKKLFLIPALLASAQTIDVKTTITAAVGTVTCTLSPVTVDTFNMDCKDGEKTILQGTSSFPPLPGSFTYSVQSGKNMITWILTKGNPVPDGWQVAVTDGTTTKSKTGIF